MKDRYQIRHRLLVWFDGSATQGACVFEDGRCLRAAIPGDIKTTMSGEYTGLLLAVLAAKEFNYRHLLITGDNKPVVNQVMGDKWQLHAEHLKIYHQHITTILSSIDAVVRWQPRATNLADAVLRSSSYQEVVIEGLLWSPKIRLI